MNVVESLTSRNPEMLIFWGAIALIALVPMIGYFLVEWRKHEADAALKRDMLQRGMSADEIERVLRAGSKSSHYEKE